MNIYEKISAIMAAVRYIQKDDHVKFNSTNYKALSEEKITEIMQAQMVKHKLVVFPIEQTCTRQGQITHVDVKYRMVNAENPDEFIEIVSSGDGADSQDKGPGKAMTYAFKYMWLRTFALPTGEDPDKVSSDELDEREAKEKARAEAEAARAKAKAEADAARAKAEAERAARNAPAPNVNTAPGMACEDCGNPIQAFRNMNAKELADYTKSKYKRCLCSACAAKAAKG